LRQLSLTFNLQTPAMITQLSQLDPNGTYTYADYLTWRFADMVELDNKSFLVLGSRKPFS
jgi:hypothetical protein